jgi:hypothetical protein
VLEDTTVITLYDTKLKFVQLVLVLLSKTGLLVQLSVKLFDFPLRVLGLGYIYI